MRRALLAALLLAGCGGQATATTSRADDLSIGRPRASGDVVAAGLRGSPAYRARRSREGCVAVGWREVIRYCNADVYVKPVGGLILITGVAHEPVTLRGHLLPRSRDGVFLALVTRGHPRVRAGSKTLSERRRRTPGAVFDDEIGENILTRTRAQVIARFGPPAASRAGCDFYRVVGDDRRRGWRFCYRAGGVMTGASGNTRLPS